MLDSINWASPQEKTTADDCYHHAAAALSALSLEAWPTQDARRTAGANYQPSEHHCARPALSEAPEQNISDQTTEARIAAARNPETEPADLTILAGDRDDKVRLGVAGNPQNRPADLARLAGDQNPNVRYHVAGNPNTPHIVLLRLSRDQEWSVRIAVGLNMSGRPQP
jgi:hypothetical protein